MFKLTVQTFLFHNWCYSAAGRCKTWFYLFLQPKDVHNAIWLGWGIWKLLELHYTRSYQQSMHCNTKTSLFWDSSLYELNSIKIACKCVPLIKPKPIPIVFIWLKEGPLWPTRVHAQGPQLFVSKPKWHAPSIVVKKYYGALVLELDLSRSYLLVLLIFVLAYWFWYRYWKFFILISLRVAAVSKKV